MKRKSGAKSKEQERNSIKDDDRILPELPVEKKATEKT